MRLFCKKLLISWLVWVVASQQIIITVALAQEIETEAAVAISTSETQVNTTAVESNIDTQVIPVTSTTPPIISPFASNSPTPSPSATESAQVEQKIENQAQVETETIASANTGDNQQVASGSASMQTGAATSLANSVTMVNTTLINSSLELSTVAIMDNWDGDIVVDPLTNDVVSGGNLNIEINNGPTYTEATVESVAQTGDNTQTVASGSASMTTGDSLSLAQNNVLVNTTIVGRDVFALLSENIWLWSGKILNSESPGSIIPASSLTLWNDTGSACGTSCVGNLVIDNQATVSTETRAIASSGGNTQQASQSAVMVSGPATAISVGNTLVNTTLINSRYRQLSLILAAGWNGNLVFAYPDIQVSAEAPSEVNEGEVINYKVLIKNRGYATAKLVQASEKIESNGLVVFDQGESFVQLGSGESITTSFSYPSSGRGGQTLSLAAWAKSDNVEESMTNNSAFVTTKINPITPSNPSETKTQESTKLRLSGVNNINNFIYPGDGVTYDMTIYNEGPIGAKNLVLTQDFYSPDGSQITQFAGKVGELGLNQRKTIRFVLQTGDSFPSGDYKTISQVNGESISDAKIFSNTVENAVPIRIFIANEPIEVTQPAKALSPEQAQVLGEAIGAKSCRDCFALPWYIAITLGSLIYYLICDKRRSLGEVTRWGLALPLAAYGGLLWSNPSCASGITFLPGAGWSCQLFLPLAYLIYLIIMNGRRIANYVSKIAVTTRRFVSKKPVQV